MNRRSTLLLAGAAALGLALTPLALARTGSNAAPNNTAASPAATAARTSQSRPNTQRASKAEVRRAQRALDSLGYRLDVDGTMRLGTRSALLKFQKTNGLRQTGRLDTNTRRGLGLIGGQPPAGSDLSGHYTTGKVITRVPPVKKVILTKQLIEQVQTKLNQRGFQVDRTGTWDQQSRSALTRFQTKNGLDATGYPDLKTLKALGITNTINL